MQNLKTALCQSDIVWENAAATTAALESPILNFCRTNKPDVLVLPETFSVGFSMNPDVSEEIDGLSSSWLRSMAARTGVALIASVPTFDLDSDGNRCRFNRCLFVCPDGTEYHYDKRHLFNYSGEGKTYTPGRNKMVVEYKGWHICLNICYDLRFPVWSRNVSNGYDLLIYIANWPDVRVKAAQALIKARAIENCCYALFCNRVGDDATCHYNGRSTIVDFFGQSTADRKKVEGVTFLTSELDAEALMHYRDKFPASKDSDIFEIKF